MDCCEKTFFIHLDFSFFLPLFFPSSKQNHYRETINNLKLATNVDETNLLNEKSKNQGSKGPLFCFHVFSSISKSIKHRTLFSISKNIEHRT